MGNFLDQVKGCLCGQINKGAEAGESLLGKVNEKFSDKMTEVIDTKLMTKCDDFFDKGIDKLVDATIDKALKSAIALAEKDKSPETETEPEEKSVSELRKESSINKLKDWGISQMLITAMEQDGWLDERIWNELNKEQLKMLGFADGHMALFLRGMESLNLRKDCAVKLLREWKISQTLIDKMGDKNYLDVDKWKELKEDRSILKSMGFRGDDMVTFLDEFDKIDEDDDDDDSNEFGINHIYIRYEELLEALIGEKLKKKVQKKIRKYWTDIKEDDLEPKPKKLKNNDVPKDSLPDSEEDQDEEKYPDEEQARAPSGRENSDPQEDEHEAPFEDDEKKKFIYAQRVIAALKEESMLDRKKWPMITRETLKGLKITIDKNLKEKINNESIEEIVKFISRKILHYWDLPEIFGIYFADKDSWDDLKSMKQIEDTLWRKLKKSDMRRMGKDERNDLMRELGDFSPIFLNKLETMRERQQRIKEKEDEAEILLKNCDISEKAIHVLRKNGLLRKSKWKHVNADNHLKGFPSDDLDKFLKVKEKKSQEADAAQYKDSDADPTLILKEWGLPSELITRLKEEGWGHSEYWGDLLDHEYYDLIDLGFRPGHISTFKRQYQKWREEQDQLTTKERKIQLLRKLDTKAVKESSILKRNIDVQNDTNELIRVRIIGERKYDSFKSSSGAAAQHASKASARSSDKSSNVSMKSSKTNDTDSSKTSDKSLDVNVGVSGVPVGGAVSVGGSVGVNKTESTTQNTKTHATQDNQRDSANKAAEARRNQSATGSNTSKAAASKHQWQKVNVGFAEIMPKQTISFPVQISDPNAVVYMTIIVPSTDEKICDNVQIDANFIKIEQVKLEGAVTKIKWQPSVKPPKNPYSRSSVYAKKGIITAEGLCDYMRAGKQPVEEWIVSAIQEKIGDSTYEINESGDMKTLERHVSNAVSIAVRLNKYDISKSDNAGIYKTIKEVETPEDDDTENNKKADASKLHDLGTYKISLQQKKSKSVGISFPDTSSEDSGLLMSDEYSNFAGYDYTRGIAKTEWFAFIVKKEHRNEKSEAKDRRRKDDDEFVLIHSDQNWYKIGQRKKEAKKKKKRNRITKEESNKAFVISDWNFWSVKTYPTGNLIVQSEADAAQSQYFQLVDIKNKPHIYKISTIKDGTTLYLKYKEDCLAADTPFKEDAASFRFSEIRPDGAKTDTTTSSTDEPLINSNSKEAKESSVINNDNEAFETIYTKSSVIDNNSNKAIKPNDENEQLIGLIDMYIETNTNIKSYKHVTDAKEDDISDQVIAIASKLEEGVPNEVLQRIYEHKLENKDKNDGLLDTNKLCAFVKQFNFVSPKKVKFIQDSLDNAKLDIFDKNQEEKTKFIETIKVALQQYDTLWCKMKDTEDDKTITADIVAMVNKYKIIVADIQKVHQDHKSHSKKCKTVTSYADHDSDDEELLRVNKFFNVDGYNILKKWKLEQFYERLVNEGWENPLDWIHLDDWVLKQNLGFRAGHIRIFNRKYDLWVKKYNDVRRTIPAKRKGKDGVLIVAPNSLKMLEPNHKYEFTKVIVRRNATLTTKSWSPSKTDGGILLINSYQEIVLEEGAKIDVSGKGYWGSVKANEKGWGHGGGGSVGWYECGAGGGGHTEKGGKGYTPARFRCLHLQFDFKTGKSKVINDDHEEENDDDATSNQTKIEKDADIYHGERGNAYGDKELSVLHDIDYDNHFDDGDNALPDAVNRHKWSLGSGGGYHAEEDETKCGYRGGNGGGAIVIICDQLIMYDRSSIRANGVFACNNKEDETRSLCAGGGGGSIYLKVENKIQTFTKDDVSSNDGIFMNLQARGGGEEDRKLLNSLPLRGIPVGIGSCGRIRVNYHSPSAIYAKYVNPYAYIAEGTERGDANKFKPEDFLQSSKETCYDALKLKNGEKYSYLIQSAKTDEVLIAAQYDKGTDIFRYFKDFDLWDNVAMICEPWYLYGDQSWAFIKKKDIGVKTSKEEGIKETIQQVKKDLKELKGDIGDDFENDIKVKEDEIKGLERARAEDLQTIEKEIKNLDILIQKEDEKSVKADESEDYGVQADEIRKKLKAKKKEKAEKEGKANKELKDEKKELKLYKRIQEIVTKKTKELEEKEDALSNLAVYDENKDIREEEEIDLWDGIHIRMKKTNKNKKENDDDWFCLKNSEREWELVWDLQKFEGCEEETLLRFIRVSNKWLIVIADESEEQLKWPSNMPLEDKLKQLKESDSYTLKLESEERTIVHQRDDSLIKMMGALPETSMCSTIKLVKFNKEHLTDESCLFYVHRYIDEEAALMSATKSMKSGFSGTDTSHISSKEMKEDQELGYEDRDDYKQEEEPPTGTKYAD